MFELLSEFAKELLGLGLEAAELEMRHMGWRAFVVFCFAVLAIRLADRRLLGHGAGFDIIAAVVLGSVLSRGINGDASFLPSLGAGALLVVFHQVLGTLAYRFHAVSQLIKGRTQLLVKDGEVQESEMRRCKITPDDLNEHLRLNGRVLGAGNVAEARLERNGSISVVRRRTPGGEG
jgi:uncharacterized membrane protein YcaP (DUF421 family)